MSYGGAYLVGKILVVAGNGEEDANGDDDKESKLGDLEESSCGTQGRHPCLAGGRRRPEIWKSLGRQKDWCRELTRFRFKCPLSY